MIGSLALAELELYDAFFAQSCNADAGLAGRHHGGYAFERLGSSAMSTASCGAESSWVGCEGPERRMNRLNTLE